MKTTTKQTKAKKETVTIEIPKELFDAYNAFVRIAKVPDTTQDLIIQHLEEQVRDSIESTRPSGLNGICDWLIVGYDYGSEEKRELMKLRLFAEVCRQNPRADIFPFYQSPRELVTA